MQKLDSSTGASLKLTVLNAEGRVWTMVAGGGASVVYSCVFASDSVIFYAISLTHTIEHSSDAIAAHGYADELANYGEYSGAPTEGQTYEYAKTISEYSFSHTIGFSASCPPRLLALSICHRLASSQHMLICVLSSRPDYSRHP